MKDWVDQNLFRLIADKAGEELYLIRSDGRLEYVNDAAAKSLGYTVEEMLQVGIPDLDPRFGPDFSAHFLRVITERDLPPFRTEHRAKNGTLIPKIIKSVALEYMGEDFVCSIAHDISLQLRMEQKLKRSEERYRSLVENLEDEYFFYSHDTKGVFSYISPSITSILGYSRDDFLLHYTEYLTDHPINKDVIEYTNLSIQGIKQPSYEVEIYHRDGTRKRLEVNEVPVFNKDGSAVVAVEGIAHDITERRHMVDELERRNVELEELNAAMKILLKQSAEAKNEVEDKLLHSLRELILPYLEDIELEASDKRRKMLVRVVKSNLEHLTSSFSKSAALLSQKLTPREIQIANLIRLGKTNKDIAELLGVTKRTIEFYRERLRSKFNLTNKKTNLRSYLLTRL